MNDSIKPPGKWKNKLNRVTIWLGGACCGFLSSSPSSLEKIQKVFGGKVERYSKWWYFKCISYFRHPVSGCGNVGARGSLGRPAWGRGTRRRNPDGEGKETFPKKTRKGWVVTETTSVYRGTPDSVAMQNKRWLIPRAYIRGPTTVTADSWQWVTVSNSDTGPREIATDSDWQVADSHSG